MATNEELAEQLGGPGEDLGCEAMPEPGPVELWLGRVEGDIAQLERVCRRNEQYPAERAANLYSQRLKEAHALVNSVPGLERPHLDPDQIVRVRFVNLLAWGRKAIGQTPEPSPEPLAPVERGFLGTVSDDAFDVLAELCRAPELTNPQLQKLLNRSKRTIDRRIGELFQHGLLQSDRRTPTERGRQAAAEWRRFGSKLARLTRP